MNKSGARFSKHHLASLQLLALFPGAALALILFNGLTICTDLTCSRTERELSFKQGWVIRRRRIIRRIVFITYLTVFFKLLRIIQFWALNEFCSHKPPRAPQKHSQALKSPTEALPSPLEPPRGTPSPSERSMITGWCL
jgi:hypothetical protein